MESRRKRERERERRTRKITETEKKMEIEKRRQRNLEGKREQLPSITWSYTRSSQQITISNFCGQDWNLSG